MEIGEYFLIAVVLLLAVSVGSAQNYSNSDGIITDGGDSVGSSNYSSDVVIGIISGLSNTSTYTNYLGVFYGTDTEIVAPTVTINSSDGGNTSSEDLLCNINVTDENGPFAVETNWYLNGGLNLTTSSGSVSSGLFSSTLDSGNISKLQNWSCSARLNDGSSYSEWGNSENMTILNSKPVVALSYPAPGEAVVDRMPTFTWTATDGDEDDMTYEINITAYEVSNDNASAQGWRWNGSLTSTSYTPSTDLEMLYDNGYYYVWKVRADDADEIGSWSDERNFSVSTTVSITMVSSDIYLGSLLRGNSSNTDDGPSPFKIENDGNVLINVSINATPLWDTESDSSSYYQFKADNESTESDSFNWLGSLTDWTNVSFTGYVVAVNDLDYEDASDTAEIDINVTVPINEDYGIKNSTIVFLGALSE